MPLDIDDVEECYLESEIPTTTEGVTTHVLVRTSDSKLRALAKGDLPVNSHNHEGETLQNLEIDATGLPDSVARWDINANQALVIASGSSPQLIISGAGYATRANSVHLQGGDGWIRVGPNGVAINSTVSSTYALKLSSTGKAIAEGWYTYPCSIGDKENIVEISDAAEKIEAIKGITFVQDGVQRAGVSAEDLDSTGLPGATIIDENGKYEGINQMVLIPLLVQAVKELISEVKALKK